MLFGHRLANDKLDVVERLVGEVEELEKELSVDMAGAIAAGLAVRLAVVKSRDFRQYLEAAGRFEEVWREPQPLRPPLERYAYKVADHVIYLVSAGRVGETERVLRGYRHVLEKDRQVAVVVELMGAALGLKTATASEREVAAAFEDEVLPAIKLFWGLTTEEEALWDCTLLKDPAETMCTDLVLLYKKLREG